jgi:hypothetical protein
LSIEAGIGKEWSKRKPLAQAKTTDASFVI